MDNACSPAFPVVMISLSNPVMWDIRAFRYLLLDSEILPHIATSEYLGNPNQK
jgi:hypothetical protein